MKTVGVLFESNGERYLFSTSFSISDIDFVRAIDERK